MQPLTIQIDRNETTRRYSRRGVWHVARILGSIFIGMLIACAWVNHDWTSRNSVSRADQAVYLGKSPQLLSLSIDTYSQPLLTGSSYSLAEGLSWSRYGLTRHIEEGETIAVTIDRAISDDIYEILALNGYHLARYGRRTVISTIEIEESTLKSRSFALNLFNNGRLHSFEESQDFSLRITDDFVQIRGLSRAKKVTSPFEEQAHLSTWEFSTVPDAFLPFSRIPAEAVEIVSFTDSEGIGFRMKFSHASLLPESLAQIGKEFMLQDSLSTTAWTISDGTKFLEVRNTQEIESTIQNSDGIVQILLARGKDVLRMTQTEEVLIISNRIISLTTEEKPVFSSCMARAKQSLQVGLIQGTSIDARSYAVQSSTILSPWDYTELVRRGRLMRLCR